MKNQLHLLLWCGAAAMLAFACFEYWNNRNAPLYKRFEIQWRQDVQDLESSQKLPSSWFDVKDLEIIGGTPETRDWLNRINIPLKTKTEGNFGMEVLVVAWEENGKRGALVQYNLVDLKTHNNIWELGRTLILSSQ